jgi:hypothetical protein
VKTVHIGRAQTAAGARKSGYMEALQKVGTPVTHFGQPFLQISDADHAGIRKQFAIVQPPSKGRDASARRPAGQVLRPRYKPRPKLIIAGATLPKPGIGLGDAIAAIATPIAKAVGMDCIDKTTGQLKQDSGCAQRKEKLNAIKLPFTGSKTPPVS